MSSQKSKIRFQDSFQTRVAFGTGLCLLLIALILTIYSVVSLRAISYDAAIKEANQTAQNFANQLSESLNSAMAETRSLAKVFSAIKDPGRPLQIDRHAVNTMVLGLLQKNDDFLGTYTVWEPNALDGQDPDFINGEGCNAQGRFAPYWTRSNGKIDVRPCGSFDDVYYQIPKKSLQEAMTDPASYEIQGQMIFMTELVVPIVHNGTFYGITGTSIALDFMQEQCDNYSVFDGKGRFAIVSNNGLLAGVSGHAELKSKPAKELFGNTLEGNYLRKIQLGSEWVENANQEIHVFVPLTIGQSEYPWSVNLMVPQEVVFAQTNRILRQMIMMAVLLIVLALLAIYALTKRFVRPLLDVMFILDDIAEGEGDLTKRIRITGQDEIAHLASAFNQFMNKLHDMILQVKENSLQIANSSREINVAMEDVAKSVENQAGTSEEISATIAEISANSEEVSGNSEQTSANVTEISQTVQNLKEGIQYLGKQFDQLNQQSQSVFTSAQEGVHSIEESDKMIQAMADSSEVISERIEAVTDIAEQIKLLALNAAIVAAQAGEHGKGFSVVADAINALAQQAGKTADEITTTVRKNVEIAQKGLEASQKTRTMMQSIAQQSEASKKIAIDVSEKVQEQVIAGNEIAIAAEDAAQRVHNVSTAMQEQTLAVNQVTEAVDQLATLAANSASSVEEVSTSNDKLTQIADQLRIMVEQFKLNESKSTKSGLTLR